LEKPCYALKKESAKINFKRKFFLHFFLSLISIYSFAQEKKSSFELYGTAMVDAGHNFNSIDPNWFDVMRPSKLPSYKNEYGPDGNVFFSVRQTKLGVRSSTPTQLGELKTQLDFDLIGFGKDAGQTTFHLVNAYGQLGKIGAGQTASVFMDMDVFPTVNDYWGPLSRVFFLNIQLRYVAIEKENDRLIFALERPGGTADGGDYANSIALQNVKPVFKLPNITAHYRKIWKWGHVQLAGIAKSIKWKDLDTSMYDLSGSAFGWGGNLSTVINLSNKIKLKMQGEYGRGIENYIADVTPDIGLKSQPGNVAQPFQGTALPVWGFLGFVEIKWTATLESSLGYSMLKIDNSDLQSANAFKKGQYGLINLRYQPLSNLTMAIEYQYGRRDNFSDGFHSNGNKIQLSFEYLFSNRLDRNNQP
jgi:outer membrane DcaP-like protein